MQIVRDGELVVGDDGSLLLSPVNDSGSGDFGLAPESGSGSENLGIFERSLLSPSPLSLPPLPGDTHTIVFTWVASITVSQLNH